MKVRYQDLQGRKHRLTAKDNLLAQALEHEIGHLNGHLYIEHLVERDAIWKLSDGPPPKYAREHTDEADETSGDDGETADAPSSEK